MNNAFYKLGLIICLGAGSYFGITHFIVDQSDGNDLDEISYAIYSDFPDGSVERISSIDSYTVVSLIHRQLLDIDDHGNIIGDLATKWDVSADKLNFRFHLDKSVQFEDGDHLTCKTVVDGLLPRFKVLNLYQKTISKIKSLDCDARGRVNLTLTTRSFNLLRFLSSKQAAIYKTAPNGSLLTLGPYKVDPNNNRLIKRLVQSEGPLSIKFLRYFDVAEAVEAHRRKQVDLVNLKGHNLPTKNVSYLSTPLYGRGWRLSAGRNRPDHQSIIKEVHASLDRKSIIDRTLAPHGKFMPAYGVIPPHLQGHTRKISQNYPENPTDEILRILVIKSYQSHPIVVETVRELQRLGYSVNLVGVELKDLYKKLLNGDYQFALYSVSLSDNIEDAFIRYLDWYVKPNQDKQALSIYKKMSDLSDKIDSSPSKFTRQSLLVAMEEIVNSEPFYVPIVFEKIEFLARKCISIRHGNSFLSYRIDFRKVTKNRVCP